MHSINPARVLKKHCAVLFCSTTSQCCPIRQFHNCMQSSSPSEWCFRICDEYKTKPRRNGCFESSSMIQPSSEVSRSAIFHLDLAHNISSFRKINNERCPAGCTLFGYHWFVPVSMKRPLTRKSAAANL